LKHGGAGGEHEESIQPIHLAGGSSEEPLTIAKGPPNRVAVVSLQRLVSAAVSMQNRFLSLPRSRRTKPFSVWWSIERVLALLVIGQGAAPGLCFVGTDERRRNCFDRLCLDERSRSDHRKMVCEV
jgi:hypothetical protein